ncbi:DNA repair protein RecO [Polymorphum gilvum]|uniref:DNA repair protein RecO n=1 Tax=Polymorphum gilvum (strain LMG 25793 / CGMCC 1.9160 / SL003B-26A1) TaxID=991905 RepID=F2IW36_POLGS|nr:DNA repair protein RecO [Polymorphum gilvum]ADZ70318.1 DNA repair protein recO [Polymorphum gilvum SL003B-26A1]
MEWSEDGIILGTRSHGESGVVLELMTRRRGRHLGLVRGGRSRRQQPVLQPGNLVRATWRARIADQLGAFTVEPLQLRAGALMDSALALHALQHLAGLLRLLPERDAHERLYDALTIVLDHLGEAMIAGPLIVRFELELLNELGFGLDLTRCAATGQLWDLAYVSPKSGRAVSRDAGAPYRDQLLPLPSFLVEGERQPGSEITFADISQGLRLTAFFLARHVLEPQGHAPSLSREELVKALERGFGPVGLAGCP